LTETDLRGGFSAYLDLIRPNSPAYATGRDVWRLEVERGHLYPKACAAHWAAAVLMEAPLALSAFVEPRFQPLAQAVFKDAGLKIMAGVVDLIDRRLERTTSHFCLARHDGGPRLLDIWVADRETGAEIPDWLNEEALARALDGPEDRLAELRPAGAAGYGWPDLLPDARRQLVRALGNQALAGLRGQAEEFHQLTRLPGGAITPPADWAEGFLHQAATESAFSRLVDAGLDRFDFEALADLVDQGWFNKGPVRFQAGLRATGEAFLAEALRDLAGGRPPRPILAGLVRFLKIAARPEGLGLDLWAGQNRWWELAENGEFMARLDTEEKEFMRELGLVLGFTPGETKEGV
jgi:hypothetical protein